MYLLPIHFQGTLFIYLHFFSFIYSYDIINDNTLSTYYKNNFKIQIKHNEELLNVDKIVVITLIKRTITNFALYILYSTRINVN